MIWKCIECGYECESEYKCKHCKEMMVSKKDYDKICKGDNQNGKEK